jgi:hypothetical protein
VLGRWPWCQLRYQVMREKDGRDGSRQNGERREIRMEAVSSPSCSVLRVPELRFESSTMTRHETLVSDELSHEPRHPLSDAKQGQVAKGGGQKEDPA